MGFEKRISARMSAMTSDTRVCCCVTAAVMDGALVGLTNKARRLVNRVSAAPSVYSSLPSN